MNQVNRRSLDREIKHLIELYGGRNTVFLTSIGDRIDFLQLGVKDLLEAHRQDRPQKIKEIAVARLFARLVCIIDHLHSELHPFHFVEILCRKYPHKGCTYCEKKPCECSKRRRRDYQLQNAPDQNQLIWSIEDWQNHLHDVYGKANEQSSPEQIFCRLIMEITEISNIRMVSEKYSQKEIMSMYAKEISDTFAWICASATRLGISLDKSNELAYGNHCWNCKQKPCECASFSKDFADWDNVQMRIDAGSLYCGSVPVGE